MKRNDLTLGGIAGLLLSMPAYAQQHAQFVAAHGAMMPATYTAAFEDQRLHLDLWSDQAFHLLRTAGSGEVEAFAGRWHADGRNLVLSLGDETLTLQVRNAERLRPLALPDDASGDLVSTGSLDPAPINLGAAGMFTYFADAPTFVHCATGLLHPVAQEGEYLNLERAYLEDQPGPAAPLFVTIDATIASRPQMEGPDRLTVIVDAFDGTWPGETCAGAIAAPRLAGTTWRIRSIGEQTQVWSPPAREPFIIFDEEDGRLSASVGCNTMLGDFNVAENDALSIGPLASTMMACPAETAGQEMALTSALEATSRYGVGGRTLRLFDADGDVTAEFEAVYLP